MVYACTHIVCQYHLISPYLCVVFLFVAVLSKVVFLWVLLFPAGAVHHVSIRSISSAKEM